QLRKNKSTSCGCVAADLTSKRLKNKKPQDATINQIINSYKSMDKNKNQKFDLTRDEFIQLIFSPCAYCGSEPKTRANYWIKENGEARFKTRKIPKDKEWVSGATIYYNGIDRIDSSIGHVKTNCISACEQCNRMKLNYTKEDFLNKIKQIHDHLKL
ncbi:MAG: hypothetical protein AABY22_23800, partial [Nanoarchaeota archaeon]